MYERGFALALLLGSVLAVLGSEYEFLGGCWGSGLRSRPLGSVLLEA